MSSTTQPSSTPLGRVIRTILITAGIFAFIGLLILLWGESTFDGMAVWLTRLIALSLVTAGLLAWRLPIKPIYLTGEEDMWYVILGWDERTVGFTKAGMRRILPIQKVEKWRRVMPLFIKHNVTAQNRLLDTFDVHVRLRFEVYPDRTHHTDARWLRDQYPKNLDAMIRGTLGDIVTTELRKVASFTQVIEQEAEQNIREAINAKFAFLLEKGIFIDEAATFVDIMVSTEVLAQRVKARAELSTLQIIRDVAHDMGITTDELLIQRALEKLPDARARQSVSEIAAVLQMLRNQQATPLPASTDDYYAEDEFGYIEGDYYDDPNDPDAEDGDSRSVYSPF